MAVEIPARIPQFTFSKTQYQHLEMSTIVCACLSIVAAFLVISMYCYLLKYHPTDANRVSLHCVISSITFSTLSQALNLAALRSNIENNFCSVFRIVDNLFTLLSSCLLAMVGVYLLLLFYFHIHYWPFRPELILMPVAIIYALLGNLHSYLKDDTPSEFHAIYLEAPHLCWHYVNLIDRVYNIKTWYYYYSFIFFIIVISFFSSLFAMRRVYIDKIGVEKRLAQVEMRNTQAPDSSVSMTTPTPDEKIERKRHDHVLKNMIARNIKRNTTPFSKIVIRSLLYPLTPCIVYIWGFALQMYLIDKNHTANFVVAVISNVMIRLEGCFIAVIFFMDPTVLKVLYCMWQKCKSSLSSLSFRQQPSAGTVDVEKTPSSTDLMA